MSFIDNLPLELESMGIALHGIELMPVSDKCACGSKETARVCNNCNMTCCCECSGNCHACPNCTCKTNTVD